MICSVKEENECKTRNNKEIIYLASNQLSHYTSKYQARWGENKVGKIFKLVLIEIEKVVNDKLIFFFSATWRFFLYFPFLNFINLRPKMKFHYKHF